MPTQTPKPASLVMMESVETGCVTNATYVVDAFNRVHEVFVVIGTLPPDRLRLKIGAAMRAIGIGARWCSMRSDLTFARNSPYKITELSYSDLKLKAAQYISVGELPTGPLEIHCNNCGLDRESVRGNVWPPRGPNVLTANLICCEIVPPEERPTSHLMITRPKETSCSIEPRYGDGHAIARLWLNLPGERKANPELTRLANTMALAPELLKALKTAIGYVATEADSEDAVGKRAKGTLAELQALIARAESTSLNFEGPANPVLA